MCIVSLHVPFAVIQKLADDEGREKIYFDDGDE